MRTLTLVLLTAVVAVGCGKKPEPVIDTSPPPKDRPRFPPKAGGDPTPQPADTDEQKVQGVWKVVGVEVPPEDRPPTPEQFGGVRMVVKGNMVTIAHTSKKRFDESFTFKGDAKASPKAVDFTDCDEKGVPLDERSREDNRGIYKFEGDELVIALAVEGSKAGYRPTEFKASLTRGAGNKGDAKREPTKQVVVIRLKKADAGETITPNPRPKDDGPFGPGDPKKTPSTRKSPTTSRK